MRLKAKILILTNTVLLVPIILYLMFWLALTLVLLVNGEASNILILLFLGLVAILLFSIYQAVKLKLAILKETGDNFLAPIKKEYWSATSVNLGGYMVFYPIILGLIFGMAPAIGGIFILIALFVALPMLKKILKTKKHYEYLKRQLRIGKNWCPDCRVSLFYNQKNQDYVCFKCAAKENYDGRFPFLLDWL